MEDRWIEGFIGIWVLLSPWIFGFAEISLAKWSSVIAGLALVLFAARALFGTRPPG